MHTGTYGVACRTNGSLMHLSAVLCCAVSVLCCVASSSSPPWKLGCHPAPSLVCLSALQGSYVTPPFDACGDAIGSGVIDGVAETRGVGSGQDDVHSTGRAERAE